MSDYDDYYGHIRASSENRCNYYNLLFYVSISIVSTFFFLFKIVQITLSLTDIDKIKDDCNGPISVSVWLTVSGIGGLFVCAYYLYKLINSYREHNCGLTDTSLINKKITNLFTAATLTYQTIWTAIGFDIFYNSCVNITPERTDKLIYTTTIVDLTQLFLMIVVIIYYYGYRQHVDNLPLYVSKNSQYNKLNQQNDSNEVAYTF